MLLLMLTVMWLLMLLPAAAEVSLLTPHGDDGALAPSSKTILGGDELLGLLEGLGGKMWGCGEVWGADPHP